MRRPYVSPTHDIIGYLYCKCQQAVLTLSGNITNVQNTFSVYEIGLNKTLTHIWV